MEDPMEDLSLSRIELPFFPKKSFYYLYVRFDVSFLLILIDIRPFFTKYIYSYIKMDRVSEFEIIRRPLLYEVLQYDPLSFF